MIVGPMFAGKTEELMRLARRASLGGRRVARFVPLSDTRSDGNFVSHAGNRLPARSVEDSFALATVVSGLGFDEGDCVVIDEAQFFDDELPVVVNLLSTVLRYDVLVAGLLRDYLGKPFGVVSTLLALADTCQYLTAVCVRCKADASFTFRRDESSERLLVGGASAYEARCRACWAHGVANPWTPGAQEKSQIEPRAAAATVV